MTTGRPSPTGHPDRPAEPTASGVTPPAAPPTPPPGSPIGGDAESAELAGHAWRGLRRLLLERNDRRKKVSEELGMSFNRVKALRRIAEAPLTLRALADFMVVDAPYTTVIVDDLVRRGLADRTTDPADRRRKVVGLTGAGRAAAVEAARVLDTPPPALTALPPEDLAELDRIVGRLLELQESGLREPHDGADGRAPGGS